MDAAEQKRDDEWWNNRCVDISLGKGAWQTVVLEQRSLRTLSSINFLNHWHVLLWNIL